MNVKIVLRFLSNKIIVIPLLLLSFIISCASGFIYRHQNPSKCIPDFPKRGISQDLPPKVCVELFVMSQCPYGVEAEKAIIPVIEEFQDQIDFHLYFIASEASEPNEGSPGVANPNFPKDADNHSKIFGHPEGDRPDLCHGEETSEGGMFKSLHGKQEVDEDIRQVVIAHYYPQKFLHYLLHRAENYQEDDWEQAAISAWKEGKWLDCLKGVSLEEKNLKPCTHGREGVDLLLKEIDLAERLNINTSPTYLVNNKILLSGAPPDIAVRIFRQMNGQGNEEK